MTTIKQNILHFVEKNNIRMIPKWRFVLYSLLWITLLVFSFALLILVGSMIIFVLAAHGFLYLPLFGLGEVISGIRSIPIILFLLTVILIILVEVLVRQYAFSFRRPVITTFLFLSISAIVLSFALTLTPVHMELRNYAKKHNINFVFHGYDRPYPLTTEEVTVLRGIVVATSSKSVAIRLFDETTIVVYASTTLPKVGEDVVVLGHLIPGGFEAIDIKIVDDIFSPKPFSTLQK